MKILIAENSVLLRERLVAMCFGITGIKSVAEAGNVSEALAAVRSLEPDLVLLDVRMAGGRGIDVLRSVKLRSLTTKVIIFTNHAGRLYQQKCLALGADYFLSKSKDLAQLTRIIERLGLATVSSP